MSIRDTNIFHIFIWIDKIYPQNIICSQCKITSVMIALTWYQSYDYINDKIIYHGIRDKIALVIRLC